MVQLRLGYLFFFSSRRRHTRYWRDWSSDVCSSDLLQMVVVEVKEPTVELKYRSLDVEIVVTIGPRQQRGTHQERHLAIVGVDRFHVHPDESGACHLARIRMKSVVHGHGTRVILGNGGRAHPGNGEPELQFGRIIAQ